LGRAAQVHDDAMGLTFINFLLDAVADTARVVLLGRVGVEDAVLDQKVGVLGFFQALRPHALGRQRGICSPGRVLHGPIALARQRIANIVFRVPLRFVSIG